MSLGVTLISPLIYYTKFIRTVNKMEINALPCNEQHGPTNGIPQLWGATAKCPLTRS